MRFETVEQEKRPHSQHQMKRRVSKGGQVLCDSPTHIIKKNPPRIFAARRFNIIGVVVAVFGSSGYRKIDGSQRLWDLRLLLKSQNLGDGSFGDYHDGGLEVAGGQVGVDAAVDDELRGVSDTDRSNM
jgi:hypothetical protein